ncbi:MAG: thiamine pyrophosphate-dependent enzyme [Acidimicrobiales bacterium]
MSSSKSTEIDEATACELYETMALIRRFEELAYRAYEEGDVEGTVHVSIGQEAVAAGVISALEPTDKVISHHRGHGHALARGVDPGRLMAELCARSTGVSGGKGGSMHATDVASGFLGTMAVVGSAVPLATGVALASKTRGTGDVCVAFFGDGAINQGVVYESMNLAALWGLPVLYVCENNSYAITTSASASTAGPGLVARSTSFGLVAEAVDGQDAIAVRAATARLLAGAREGEPALLECMTYRFMGHSRGDPPHGLYRSKDEVETWRERDPLSELARRARLSENRCDEIRRRVDEVAVSALEYARASEPPREDALYEDVWG